MQVHRYQNSIPLIPEAVVTIGTFDGVHIGHQHLIEILLAKTKEINGQSVVISFEPHPRNFLFPNEKNVPLLTTQLEKEKLLSDLGIDHLIIIPFDEKIAEMSALNFLNSYLIDKINMRKIIVGYDHTFGKNKEGDVNFLKKNSDNRFEVIEIPAQLIDNIAVSSTKIRNAIQNNFSNDIKKYLGRSYAIDGFVVKGQQLGRQLGTPTANISISDSQKLLPKNGVYLVKIENASFQIDFPYGICNIGTKPTLGNFETHIEVHIFDFDKEIYKEWMQVSFLEFIRDEKKFQCIEELKKQINSDKILAYKKANKYFSVLI